VAAAVVIALLILASVIVRAFGGKIRGRHGSRLAVSEFYEIDNERRLVLVRRDDREHLLLIGGTHDIVVESGIEAEPLPGSMEQFGRAAPRREPMARPGETDDNGAVPLRPSPRPAVFGDRKPLLRPVGRDEPKLGNVSGIEDGDR
jgi:hypothetical protein